MKKQKTRAEVLREELEAIEEQEDKEKQQKRLEEYTEKYVGKVFGALKTRQHEPEIIVRVDSVEVDDYDRRYDEANATILTFDRKDVDVRVCTVKIHDFWFSNLINISKKLTQEQFLKKFDVAIKILQTHVKLNSAKKIKKK